MKNMQVKCMINRYWDTDTREFDGDWVEGTLIDISTQTAEDSSGKLIPVGVVLLDDDYLLNEDTTKNNAFQSVPMEFIKRFEDS